MASIPENWQAISRLLDEALELPPGQRASWLASLPAPDSAFREQLGQLLAAHTAPGQEDFLATLPRLREGEPPDAQDPDLVEGALVGPYRLVREIGRGGMGTVWLAERTDGSIKRQIALKLPHSNLPQRQLAERFARERDILAGLTHANIARLYDAGVTEDGRPYLALEYVDGQPLNAYCDARQLTVRARLELFLQVLSALQYAHGLLVVHRDLKPSNILVTASGELKLLDFGIAKLLIDGETHETELTRLGGRALTPRYASPEQILGQPIGTASDVYALGVVLYELLAGSLPYRPRRDSRGALEDAILDADAPPPSRTGWTAGDAQARGSTARRLRSLLQGDLDTIVLKALKKNASERYATAQLFADDLRRFLAGEAVQAQPDSTWYRTRKFVRRNWLGVGAAGAVMVSLATGLTVALWQANAARQEAQTARAVQEFLLDIFQANSSNQADPQKARNTTARELLDIGAKKIDSALATEPETKLVLYDTLGQLYRDLGIDRNSAELHRKRVALARSTYGNDSMQLADALVDLADALMSSLDDPDIASSIAEAGAILDRRGDTRSILRGRLLASSASFYQERDLHRAVESSEGALLVLRRHPPSRLLATTLSTAAQSYTLTGNWSRAKALLDEAIAVAQGPGASSQADLLPALLNGLGSVSSNLGNPMEAEASFARSWQLAQARNGDDHVETIMDLVDYANQLLLDGRSADAIAKLELAIAGSKQAKGADAAEVQINVLETYGDDLMFYGRLEDALPVLTRARESLASAGDSPRAATLLAIIAHLFTEMGRFEEAQSLLARAHAMRVHANALDGSWDGAERMFRLRLLLAQGRVPEADTLARSFSQDPGPSRVLRPGRLMENFYRECIALAARDAKGALALAQSDLRDIEESPMRDYYRVAEQRSRLTAGRALSALGQEAAAQSQLRRSLGLAEKIFDPLRSPQLAETGIALAQSLLADGRVREARELAARAHAIHATHRELGRQYREPLGVLEARLSQLPARSGGNGPGKHLAAQ